MAKILDRISDRKEIIILGDSNGKTVKQRNNMVVGRFGENY